MFTIGEFSIITRLSVKTLRYYHDEEILIPDYIEEDSGYRYYRESSVDRAAVITALRSLEFSISDIKEIIKNYSEDIEVIDFLEAQREKIKSKITKYKQMDSSIEEMIITIRNSSMKYNDNYDIEEKILDDIIFAGYRFKGRYSEVGKGFRAVSRAAGRYIAGKEMSLYYDEGYRESDADIESGFPVSRTIKADCINCRVLEGGRAVTLIHKGSYNALGTSYEKIFKYMNEHKYKVKGPCREIYIKGYGVIFKGNPDKYLTEIQFLLK